MPISETLFLSKPFPLYLLPEELKPLILRITLQTCGSIPGSLVPGAVLSIPPLTYYILKMASYFWVHPFLVSIPGALVPGSAEYTPLNLLDNILFLSPSLLCIYIYLVHSCLAVPRYITSSEVHHIGIRKWGCLIYNLFGLINCISLYMYFNLS